MRPLGGPLFPLLAGLVLVEAASSGRNAVATNLTGDWRLFLDDTHVADTSGEIHRSFHSFTRAHTPFFALEHDEAKAIGASGVFPYHSLLPPDGSSKLWRMWYDCWRDVWGVCLALSDDGLVWRRPKLGQVNFSSMPKGITEPSNVVLARRSNTLTRGPLPAGAPVCESTRVINASFPPVPTDPDADVRPACIDTAPSVVYTPWEKEAPFKLINFNYAYGQHPEAAGPSKDGFYSASSVDGISFVDDHRTNPALHTDYPRNPGDLANFGWDYHRDEYLVSARQRMNDSAIAYCRRQHPPECRCVGWATSKDYRTWTQPTPVLCADSLDDHWVKNLSSANHTELYNMPVFAYQQGYIGLVWVARFGSVDSVRGNNEGTIHVELGWSSDGKNWNRPPATKAPDLQSAASPSKPSVRPQLIPRGDPGAWDSEMVMTSNTPFHAVDENGRDIIRLSYIGCPFLHSAVPAPGKPCAIGWAALRRDGFASLDHSGAAAGAVTTIALGPAAAGATLLINYEVSSNNEAATSDKTGTPAGGRLRVALLTFPTGSELPGYSASDCAELVGNSTAQQVVWGAHQRLPIDSSAGAVAGMALHFVMEGDVSLFGFALSHGDR